MKKSPLKSRIASAAKMALLLIAASRSFAFAEKEPGSADADTVKLVEFVLKTPTTDLPPKLVPPFMEVSPKTLPAKLQAACEGKQLELRTLLKLSKPKPPIRRFGMEEPKCGEPVKGSQKLLTAWRFAGYVEVDRETVDMAMEETHCSECELETEFTLQHMLWEEEKGKKKRVRFFFHGKDPVWIFISIRRAGKHVTTGTAFFGIGGPPQCH